MKIAHLYQESNIRFHVPQAAQVHIYHTMHGLQQAGHEVSLLALQGRRVLCTQDLAVFNNAGIPSSYYGQLGVSGSALFKGIESGVRRLQSELHLPYLALFDSYRMAEAVRKNLKGFQLIHERFNLLSLGGTLASRKLGIPYVLEVNADLLKQREFKGSPEKGLRRLLAEWATRLSFNAADQIICVSASLKNHLETHWEIKTSKLNILYCAADLDEFKLDRTSKTIREGLGLTDEPVVMWVGGFFPWHDLELLLESFVQVLQERPEARLVLVGDGETRESIEQKVLDAEMKHAVILTGSIPHSEVPKLLSIADIAVVPSVPIPASRGGTGTPLKLFEFMAAGKAIVATSYDQAEEVIRHGRTGLLVKAGDADEFARAILTLINHPEERSLLGLNARKVVEEKYSWEHYIKKLEEIYVCILQNAPSISPAMVIS